MYMWCFITRMYMWCLAGCQFKEIEKPMLQAATLLKVTLLHGCFSRFLNCTNDTKFCKVSQMCKVSYAVKNALQII